MSIEDFTENLNGWFEGQYNESGKAREPLAEYVWFMTDAWFAKPKPVPGHSIVMLVDTSNAYAKEKG